jgi:hypothetical protein
MSTFSLSKVLLSLCATAFDLMAELIAMSGDVL